MMATWEQKYLMSRDLDYATVCSQSQINHSQTILQSTPVNLYEKPHFLGKHNSSLNYDNARNLHLPPGD